ncbi:hypothetical protein ATANTOWER_003777, partial [Ataeniobius toweri]|nr:hypothetical protein [Ataeniobius toweri]
SPRTLLLAVHTPLFTRVSSQYRPNIYIPLINLLNFSDSPECSLHEPLYNKKVSKRHATSPPIERGISKKEVDQGALEAGTHGGALELGTHKGDLEAGTFRKGPFGPLSENSGKGTRGGSTSTSLSETSGGGARGNTEYSNESDHSPSAQPNEHDPLLKAHAGAREEAVGVLGRDHADPCGKRCKAWDSEVVYTANSGVLSAKLVICTAVAKTCCSVAGRFLEMVLPV